MLHKLYFFLSVTYTLCSKKYGVIQSSTWAEHTMDAIYELDIGGLDCPGFSSSVGDPSNEGKTLEVIYGDMDAEFIDIVIDDEPVDDSMRPVFKRVLFTGFLFGSNQFVDSIIKRASF